MIDLNVGDTRILVWYPLIEKKEEWRRQVKMLWNTYDADDSGIMNESE